MVAAADLVEAMVVEKGVDLVPAMVEGSEEKEAAKEAAKADSVEGSVEGSEEKEAAKEAAKEADSVADSAVKVRCNRLWYKSPIQRHKSWIPYLSGTYNNRHLMYS